MPLRRERRNKPVATIPGEDVTLRPEAIPLNLALDHAAAGIIGEADALATAAARLLHTPALRGLPVKEGIARLRSTRLENDREPALSQTHKGVQKNRR